MRLIDADELIEHAWRDKVDSRELIAEMIEKAPTIKKIPTKIPIDVFEKLISPEPRWIPCSERLPENYVHVLCQFTLGGMGECYLAHGMFHVVGGLVMTCNEVIAWMPLPDEYRKD